MCVWDQQRRWVLEYVEPAECVCMGPAGSVLARNLGVHNEIHYIQKLREALPSQVFEVVAKSNGATWFVFRPDHRGHFGNPKALVEA